MKSASVVTILTLLAIPGSLCSKGPTLAIRISGGDMAAPVTITDPAVIDRFHFGGGPATAGMIMKPGDPYRFPLPRGS